MTIDAAPYDKLLPFVKCIIHHGGIGTITACMQAGKPFFSCPVMYPFGDQYFWAMVAYQKGIAIKLIPLKKLTPVVLIEKTKELLRNKELYKKAQDICHQLKLEDGVKNAVEEIENF
jgi:sterol 3beta-glucosyltransferase